MYRSFVGSKWKEANVTIWLNAYGHFRSTSNQTKDSIYWFIFSSEIGLQSPAIMVHSYALMRPDFFLFATEFLQWKEQKWRKNLLKTKQICGEVSFQKWFCCYVFFLGNYSQIRLKFSKIIIHCSFSFNRAIVITSICFFLRFPYNYFQSKHRGTSFLTTVSLNARYKENIAWKNWIKKPFHVRFIGAALLSMKKTGTFMKIAVMTIARIIGVYIIVFECTGQHAKKIQQQNNKSRPKHKKTVNYREKQNNIKARADKHSCACISKRFFLSSLLFALLLSFFICCWIHFGRLHSLGMSNIFKSKKLTLTKAAI